MHIVSWQLSSDRFKTILPNQKMAKRFKLKLSRLITSLNSCRSNDASPSVLSFLRFSQAKLHLPPPPPSKAIPSYSSVWRRMSSAFASFSSRFRSRSPASPLPPPEFHWEQEEKWHVVAKIFDGNVTTPRRKIHASLVCSDRDSGSRNYSIVIPPPPPNTEGKRRKTRKKKGKVTPRVLFRLSTSSADNGIYFSSEGIDDEEEEYVDNEETETLVSSTRSESSPRLEMISESSMNRMKNHRHRKKSKKGKRSARRKGEEESTTPARLSRFQRMIPCRVDGKVRESYAVVKRSEDPYEDFKRSMMEMITEKEMWEVKDLEQLLQCMLSLNSRDHHGVIVEAFCQIWDNLHCNIIRAVSV